MAKQCTDLQNIVSETKKFLHELETLGRIKEAININNFIAPPEEIVDNVDKDLMDQIVGRYGAEREAKTDEEKDVKELIGLKQAVKALKTLKFYKKQQEKRNLKLLEEL